MGAELPMVVFNLRGGYGARNASARRAFKWYGTGYAPFVLRLTSVLHNDTVELRQQLLSLARHLRLGLLRGQCHPPAGHRARR